VPLTAVSSRYCESIMAKLDYVLLADYAAIPGGQLTVVGASFTQLVLASVPRQANFALAGRVLVPESADGFELGIAIKSPDDHALVEFDGFLDSGTTPVVDGHRGTLFSMQVSTEVTDFGIHTVIVKIDRELVRTLKFDVVPPRNNANEV